MSQLSPAGTTLPASTDREPSLLLTTGTATDVGGRSENQDSVVSRRLPAVGTGEGQESAGQLLAVADGMGGHENGDLASQIAIESLLAQVERDGGTDPATLLKRAYREANSRIFETGTADGSGESNMGTTLVAAVVRGKYATIANVGDSRAYLIRANRVNQLTQDHSLVAQQVAKGEISAADARTSPHRNRLTQALGQRQKLDNRLPDIFEITLLPKDRLLLCSDGLYDVVPDADLLPVILGSSAEVAASTLVDLGKQRGASDNVSAVVLAADREIVEPVVEVRDTSGTSNTIVMVLIVVGVILLIAIVVAALTIL
ncbi:MAG TPA: protein phosphatase 2C domain-containing protein [Thermomicrobiales bacterium]|nr:protein phosphatase 2C domain-containing protein [Thermomicrobiales bacterium]